MLASWTGRGFGALLGLVVALSTGTDAGTAQAKARPHHASAHRHAVPTHRIRFSHHGRYASRHWVSGRHWANVLQCVPFARENSGIELAGNANTWWAQAEGIYERGSRPEVGSILNFRANGHMRLGHVAVVTNVINSRHIEIDQANWSGPGRISRDIDVVDVSPANDWSAVRVAIGDSDATFGSVYPTYGFIYDRPDNGIMLANNDVTAAPLLDAAPADLRSSSERLAEAVAATAPEEVAEAPDAPAPRSTARHARAHRSHRIAHAHSHTRGRSHETASVYQVIGQPVPHRHHRRHF